MNGYQIIQQIAERSGGAWKPSPGSVYPTVQQLEDEGLVEGREVDGRASCGLTDAGRHYVEEHPDEMAATWRPSSRGARRSQDEGPSAPGRDGLMPVVGQVMGAMWRSSRPAPRSSGPRRPRSSPRPGAGSTGYSPTATRSDPNASRVGDSRWPRAGPAEPFGADAGMLRSGDAFVRYPIGILDRNGAERERMMSDQFDHSAHGTRAAHEVARHDAHHGHDTAGHHGDHDKHSGQNAHAGHDAHAGMGHAGHGDHVAMFRRLFWIMPALAVPTVLLNEMFASIVDYSLPDVAGITWIPPILGTVMYLWGGRPFLTGG